MNFLKLILILLGLGLGVMLLFWLLGVVSTILWYLLWAGIIGVIGYAGYKLFLGKGETPQLEEKKPIAIAEIHDFDRALEEYKEKTLKNKNL